MRGQMILIVGGTRSGKSSFALQLAAETGRHVCFVATADDNDEEMRERIQRHRASRPSHWSTLELKAGVDIPELPQGTDVAILDCFTVYLANLMASNGLDWPPEQEDSMPEKTVLHLMEITERQSLEFIEELRLSVDALILITNEVGMGLVPPFRLGRIFRDLTGRINQKLTQVSNEVYAVFAGMPIPLKSPGKDQV